MEQHFVTMFQDVRHERSLISLLSLTDPNILKQSKITDDEKKLIKNLALAILHRQKCLKECFAIQLLNEHFLFNNWVHIQFWKLIQKCWR